ncbi:Biopolymer transport protein exbD [Fusobacterium necrogenes]|uniref:Biopolymer transport protein exbD n=1 Tax=Fusobacterium necrogenes TaxID=858 RepID=A0A377GWR6_9FUSO|nr:biopolymer transporter ExbD [Fusobacterium necrogenes]STO31409.1 Biopolymer transport protein exbD [Fusobacterium necrogenes]
MGRFRKKRPIMALDLTPLIDVVFLLIIFFMVSTTFNKYGSIEINLPSANINSSIQENKSVEIIIDKEEKYFISKDGKIKAIKFEDLETILQGVKEVTVSGDKELKYQVIIDTVSKVKNAGIENLGINYYE